MWEKKINAYTFTFTSFCLPNTVPQRTRKYFLIYFVYNILILPLPIYTTGVLAHFLPTVSRWKLEILTIPFDANGEKFALDIQPRTIIFLDRRSVWHPPSFTVSLYSPVHNWYRSWILYSYNLNGGFKTQTEWNLISTPERKHFDLIQLFTDLQPDLKGSLQRMRILERPNISMAVKISLLPFFSNV